MSVFSAEVWDAALDWERKGWRRASCEGITAVI